MSKLLPGDYAVELTGECVIKLFVPEGSPLSESDIERVSSIASWRVNPNELSDVSFNGRSVIIDGESGVGLQISGVGYLPVEIGLDGDTSLGFEGEEFFRPSSRNFLEGRAGTVMGWTTPEKKRVYGVSFYALVNHYSTYKPAGTYDFTDLSKKVLFTSEVSRLNLKHLLVPSVAAYGYYLGDEMSGADGPFGFVVFTTPNRDKERFVQEVLNRPSTIGDLVGGFSCMARGLRELHDKGYAHLQPHGSNFYVVNDMPFLMDWSTMERFGSNKELNLIYRVIDLNKLRDNLESILKSLRITDPSLMFNAMSIIMGSYVGEVVDLETLYNLTARFMNKPSDVDVMTQLMLEYNVEGFDRRPKRLLVQGADESLTEFVKNKRISKPKKRGLNKYERARLRMNKRF